MCESSFCYTEECEKLKHMDYDLLENRILEALTEEDNSVREIGKSVIVLKIVFRKLNLMQRIRF